jgi:hypothetical protein
MRIFIKLEEKMKKDLKKFNDVFPEINTIIHLCQSISDIDGMDVNKEGIYITLCGRCLGEEDKPCGSAKWKYRGRRKKRYLFACIECGTIVSFTGSWIRDYYWKPAE